MIENLLETENKSLAITDNKETAKEWKRHLEKTSCPPVSIYEFELNDPPSILKEDNMNLKKEAYKIIRSIYSEQLVTFKTMSKAEKWLKKAEKKEDYNENL